MSFPRPSPLVFALACLGVLLSAALVPVAGAEQAPARAAVEPLIGYNDDFNHFELHRRNTEKEVQLGGLQISLPGTGGNEPPERVASGGPLIDEAAAGGADTIRYGVPWQRVEWEQGAYDFSIEDQTYDLTLEAGLKPVIILLTSPCWAHPSIECDQHRAVRPDPQYLDDFARFAAATVERYPKAAAFEVWNESNDGRAWGEKPTPRAYQEMLDAVEAEVSKLPAHPPLLYNGLLPKPGWLGYLKRSYKVFDKGPLAGGTAIHPYVGDRGAKQVKKKIVATKRILREVRAPRKVWITEIGWSTDPGAETAVNPATQASRIAKLETIAAKLRTRALIIHRLRDIEHTNAWEAGLGAVRRNGSPKPLYCELGERRLQARPAIC